MSMTTIHWTYLPIQSPINLTHVQIKDAVARACDEWNKCLAGLVELREGLGDLQVYISFDTKIDRKKYPTTIGQCRDYSNPKHWEISIDMREKWNVGGWRKVLGIGYDLRSCLLHELGHIFDLPHSDNPDYIMFSDYTERLKLSRHESKQYRDFFINREKD